MKIASKVKYLLASMAIMAVGVATLAMPAKVSAATVYCPNGQPSSTNDLSGCEGYEGNANDVNLMGTLNTIINVALGVIGFLAVVMIIVGGVQYTTSAGDAQKVTKAKNTIMYGIIGLVIALLAYAIVNFVLANVFKTN